MKFNFRNCLRLKPFDETADVVAAGGAYAGSSVLSVAVIAGALLGVVSLALAVVSNPAAVHALAAATGVSAIAAGLEWHAGLKARSLNQLFAAVVVALGFGLLRCI